MINLFDSANYQPSAGNLRSSTFGQVLEAGPVRQLEIAAKFHF